MKQKTLFIVVALDLLLVFAVGTHLHTTGQAEQATALAELVDAAVLEAQLRQ